ncbi:MAG: DEAD/DEAH box helicase [Bacteroidia bacterium]|nr:DEAD/DEAH box helicase [Bacteroidia bacterium]
MSDRLIITLSLHPKFGYVLQPVFASFNSVTEAYAITETACGKGMNYENLSDAEKNLVKAAQRISDKELMKAFSREITEADFLQKITPETIKNYIRPFIEARHKEMLLLLREMKIPLFWREKIRERDFRANQAIEILRHPSKMIFLFRHADAFTYSVRVQNGDDLVDLFGEFFAPLCSKPALAVIGKRLHYFEDVDEKKLRPFFVKKQVEVPSRNVPEYIRKFVLQCVKEFDVVAEGFRVFEQTHRPEAVLTLETGLHLVPVLNLKFRYGKHLFAMDRPLKKEVELTEQNGEFSIGWFFRDEMWEKKCVELLLTNGLILDKSNQFTVMDNERSKTGVIEWINRNESVLRHFELTQSLGKHVYYTGEIGLELAINGKKDWFDIQCVVRFGDLEIPFIRFRNHILNNIAEYVLPDGRVAVLPSKWFTRFGDMFRFGKSEGDDIRLAGHHFRVKELAENGTLSDENPESFALTTEAPGGLNATLRPYQLYGLRWLTHLRQNRFGGCLADDMGLGKTLQTIAALLYSYAGSEKPATNKVPVQLSLFDEPVAAGHTINNDVPPSLIVMPTSLVHNWLSEIQKFAPQLSVYTHTGTNRLRGHDFLQKSNHFQLILTTYGTVRQDIDFLQHSHFHYVILDESQHIKNPQSQTFFCVKQLQARHKLTLTGTPVENSIVDLWAQMDFLNPGILGKMNEFQERFRELDFAENEENAQSILKIISPFILRRTKEQVAPELPPLTEEIRYCEMSEEQAARYNDEKNKIRNAIMEQFSEENRKIGFSALASLMRLRQIANHPALVDDSFAGQSGKFGQVIEAMDTLFQEGHKVLVFSSFVKHLQLFADYFDERRWQYAWLTGQTTKREAEISKFNSDADVRAFFISLKAGGTGLNLTAADYVFILDPWWNPAAEMQAVSRAHRIGQERKVTLYRFIAQDTVEEKIRRLQQYKSALSDALIRPQLTLEDMEKILQ